MRTLFANLTILLSGFAVFGAIPDLEESLLAMERRWQENFDEFAKVVAKIDHDKAEIYEGLPHQMWERQLLDEEMKRNDIVESGGFMFYDEVRVLEGSESKSLLAVLMDPNRFKPYEGAKLCGGFHPDYEIVGYNEGVEHRFQICFGCHEVKLLFEDQELFVDIEDEAFGEMRSMFDKFRRHRPDGRNR